MVSLDGSMKPYALIGRPDDFHVRVGMTCTCLKELRPQLRGPSEVCTSQVDGVHIFAKKIAFFV